MKRAAAIWIGTAVSCIAGIGCAELAAHSITVRDQLGIICGRGHLLALVRGRGIYQADVDRALHESDYARDIERNGAADIERRATVNKLIANVATRSFASSEKISDAQLKHEVDLLGFQFPNAKVWEQSLNASHLSISALAKLVGDDLRVRQWISRRIGPDVDVAEDECRRFYDSHSADFFVPERIHASHIFLAAPPETAPETVEAKRKTIETLSVRLNAGEDFAALAAESSEDEATKLNGGDLGWFSTARMPPDFVAAAAKLRSGDTTQPVQTRLGFHIIRLIETVPARQRTFEEVKSEIAIDLANQKRVEAIRKLVVDLGAEARYLRAF